VPVSHRVVGSGDHHVLALHGWFGSAQGWGSLPLYLDGSAYTYAFMDYRGYGAARDQPGDHTMDEVAGDALRLADELGWETFDLVGHSMGGMAVQRVLVEAPHRVGRLVGVNPVPATGVPFDDQGWALFSGAAGSRENRTAIIDLTTGNRLTRTFIEHVVEHSLEHCSQEAFADYLHAWARTDFSERCRGNQTPVKVIVGEHDPALSADVMRQTWLQMYPNAELEVVPNAGHYPMFETPVALATTIEEFLSRQ
jgi:pimeloyl-ACP methyl ester carboxylesterase